MVALLEEKVCDGGRRRHPGREGIAGDAALEHRHILFQRHTRRVLRARVLEALVLADALLDIGRGLIDRDRHRTRCRIRFLTRVNSVCFKTHYVILAADYTDLADFNPFNPCNPRQKSVQDSLM